MLTLPIYYYSLSDITGSYSVYGQDNYLRASPEGIYVDDVLVDDLTLITPKAFFYAGEYLIVGMFDDPNYILDNSHTLAQELTMNKAEIELYLVGYTITYDGFTHYVSAAYTQTAERAARPLSKSTFWAKTQRTYPTTTTPTAAATIRRRSTAKKDAGIYYIKAIIDDPDPIIVNNYELWVRYATLTIDIRTITVTSTSAAADWTKVYDSTDDYYDYILTGICASDITKLSHYAKYNNKNAESGKTISFYLTDNNPLDKVAHNYLINDITDGVILKKELRLYEEIIWSKVYDGVIYVYPKIGETVIYDLTLCLQDGYDIFIGDSVFISASYDSKNVNEVTKVDFTLSGADAGNYRLDPHCAGRAYIPLAYRRDMDKHPAYL